MNPFELLNPKDIQEKVDLNIKQGLTLEQIRIAMIKMKNEFQRSILRQQCAAQNVQEQIEYVEALIREGKNNG